ncbi:MAG: type I DNA topoisomerase [bacterium]|nr:type I DNA topoisomerase [bacterium]
MDLIIVESPTKARTLSRFLGKDYIIDATMGHIKDLPKNKLGVDTEHDFTPEYVAVKKKTDAAKAIRDDAKKADKIYLATDPDREGEAIAYHVQDMLQGGRVKGKRSLPLRGKGSSEKYKRVVFHEITQSAVKHALENPREIDIALFHAQQARRVLDRLVGYKLSPLLWKKVRKGLSAGRVQSVVVRLIVEREREIGAFKADEYWEVFVQLTTQNTEQREEFTVRLVKIKEDKAEVKNQEQAGKIVEDLEKASYKVDTIDKKEISKSPPPPFTTSTMAQAASRNNFWSAKKTMSVAQRLYEEGLITYHRTDSTYTAEEAIVAARTYIQKTYGAEYVPEKPRLFKIKSKVAQEAHEAIRPTDLGVSSSQSPVTSLGNDAEKLYGLIWRRFLATQMAKSVADQTTINVKAQGSAGYMLQVGGQVVKFDGWRKVYGKKIVAEEDVVLLPEVTEGEALEKQKVTPEQKFTEPPPRYNEASLVKTLEKLGIGRPSTYAPTISTIQDRQYVEKNEGKFFPTSLGEAVNDFLIGNFPDIFEYDFTAKMEDDLDEIAKGEKKWVPVIREFWKPFEKKLEGVEETAKRVKIEVEVTGEKCPKCKDGEQVIRTGKFGKFLSCSTFPDCDWKAPYVEKINMKCPDCQVGEVIIKKTRFGKKFFGCSRYPDCKFASWKKPVLPVGVEVVPVVEARG